MALKNIVPRVIFVVWAVPLTILLVGITYDFSPFFNKIHPGFMPIYLPSLMAIALILLAAHEYINMLSKEFASNGFKLVYIWLIPTLLSSLQTNPYITFKQSLFLLVMLGALESFYWGKDSGRWKRFSLFFSGTIFLYLAGSALFEYFQPTFISLWKWPFPSAGIMGVNGGFLITLLAIFMNDIAAYFVGSLFGKHQLSSISPKKTIEGSIGGLVFSILVMTIGIALGGSSDTPLYFGIILGIVVGVFGQVGDLTVSLMKRYFDVKDSSNLIPGHGGILDRFDSMFFTAPVIMLTISLLLKIK